MKVVRTHPPADGALTQAFAGLAMPGGARLEFGTARLSAGSRVPATGESRHSGVEVSYVLSGVVDVTNAAGTQQISSGDLVIVPAKEWHYSQVREEALLIYVFIEDPA